MGIQGDESTMRRQRRISEFGEAEFLGASFHDAPRSSRAEPSRSFPHADTLFGYQPPQDEPAAAGGGLFILDEVPAITAHIVDAAAGLPAKLTLGLGSVCVALGNVAGTAGGDLIVHLPAAGLLEGMNHVQHGVALAGAQVVGLRAVNLRPWAC